MFPQAPRSAEPNPSIYMGRVHPFRAWHYHPGKIAISRVIAPPYDVISAEVEEQLYKRDPYNVVRLELGIAKPEDLEKEERYAKPKRYLDEWIQKKILVQEDQSAFYLYEMTFKHPFQERVLSRLSVFALLKLEPFDRKTVFPHEKTHASPKVDRGKLLRSTHSNFSPVFTIYEDTTKILDEIRAAYDSEKPLFDFKDSEGIQHRIWVIHEEKVIARLAEAFDRKRVFIADGHHRYSTALQYAQEMNNQFLGELDPAWNYVLAAFVRFNDPGLLILPIHRVILKAFQIGKEEFLIRLKKHFVLHSVSRAMLERISEGGISEGFGLAFSGTECYLLELKDKTTARQEMPHEKPENWYDFDMNLVFHLILNPIFGIKESEQEWNIFYTPSTEEVFGKLADKEASCAFIIRPVTAAGIKNICESGELMPQKSTYFYPKFPSGLLIYRH